MEELELVKENVLPLRRGRAVPAAGLAGAEGLDRPRAAKLEEERRAFQEELAGYAGDDPLAVWLRYLAWTQAHFPAGGPGSQLLATLENCTRELLHAARYRDDVRYLRVWVQYADCCSEPKEIFDFLEHQSIGQDFALFYEARATFLELRGNFPQAHAAYEAGINRGAQPAQRLKSKFASFEARMALRLQRKQADEALGIVEDEAVSARETLASRPVPAAAQRPGPRMVTNTMEARLGQKRPSENSCGSFDVFVDDDAAPGDPGAPPAAAAKWSTLGTQADIRKENTQAPSAWNNARVPQARAAPRGARAAFVLDVYEDEEFEEADAPAAAPAAQAPSLRKRLEDDATDLHSNPLLNHGPGGVAPQASLAHASATASSRMPANDACQPLQVDALQWLTDSLVSAKAKHPEMSFEEARAARWLERTSAAAQAASTSAMAVDDAPLASPPKAMQPAAAPMLAASVAAPASPETAAPLEEAAAAPLPEEALPVPAALAFCAPQPRSLDGGVSSIFPTASAEDPNMTVNMRDAYTDIMNMFSDALPAQAARKRSCTSAGAARPAGGAAPAPVFEIYDEDEEGAGSAGGSPIDIGTGVRAFAAPPAAAAARPAPLFEVYEEEEEGSPGGSPIDIGTGVFRAFSPPAAAPVLDDGMGAEDESFPDDGENADPLQPLDGAVAAPLPPPRALDEAAVLQPLYAPDYRAADDAPTAEDAAEMLEAEAALRSAASPEALAAQDSFEIFEDPAPGAMPAAADAESINPFSASSLALVLASLEEPVAMMQGVTVEDESAAAKLEASLSAARRHPHSGVVLQLGGFRYVMGKLCGRGAYADIYEAADEDDADSDGEGGAAAAAPALALKVVRPPDAAAVSWEFVVLRRVAARVPACDRQLFLQARRLHMAGPHAVLVAPFGPHGSLQDAVNAAMGTDRVGAMQEPLAMYFTVELLRCLEVLHAAGFIHADVKPDNVLLRNSGAAWEEWAPQRPGSWRQRGLALIDFGRSIDLGAHAPGTTFAGDCGTENFRCVEMQTGVPWTFQADTFGLLGCVHVMLWGSYMDVECDAASGRWRRRAPLKRYWQAELWEPLFDALLNVSSCAQQPALPQFRAAFEAHLATPERARALRAQLMDLTILMHENATKAA